MAFHILTWRPVPSSCMISVTCITVWTMISLADLQGFSYLSGVRAMGPVEFGKISFERSKLGNLMQSKRTGLPF